jgi:predicted small metal-binding protein
MIVTLILRKGVVTMDKIISCKDLGSECGFTACASTEVGLFKEVLEHGHTIHHMKEFSPEFYDKVRSSIQEGYCDLEGELCKYGECSC